MQLIDLCCSITDVIDSIQASTHSLLYMVMCIMDITHLWSAVSVLYIKCKVDSCPAKKHFDFWPSASSVVVPWLSSWLRTKIGVQNIGVPPLAMGIKFSLGKQWYLCYKWVQANYQYLPLFGIDDLFKNLKGLIESQKCCTLEMILHIEKLKPLIFRWMTE